MKKAIVFTLLLAASFSFSQNETPPLQDVVRKIIDQIKQNEKHAEEYGFYLESNVKKLTAENTIKEQEVKTYRVTWIENEPFLELLQVNGKEPDRKELKKEKERKEKFLKSLRDPKKKDPEDEDEEFSWDDIPPRYEFTSLPSDENGSFVISFRPKKGKLPERNRTDKLINRLSGRIWADQNYNLVKIDAGLTERVRYGLGLIAKIDELHVEFMQQQHNQIWMPSALLIRGRAQFALLKTERREIRTRYYDYYKKPTAHTPIPSSN